MNILTLLLRFIIGTVIGAIFVFVVWGLTLFSVSIPIYIVIAIILLSGISAVVWGDNFILWFSRVLKHL